MFRILHDDGREYGPVSADGLRQWIREARAHAATRVQREGETEWRRLSDFPEFQAELTGARGANPNEPVAGAKTSRLAITSLILGILGFFSIGVTAVFGLILGVIAMVRVGNSRGQLRGRGLAISGMVTSGLALAFIPVIAILAAMLLPALSKAKDKAQSISCINNMKQVGLAVRMYSINNNDTFPTTNWCDAMLPELGTTNVLICPSAEGVDCGYAFNVNLVGKSDNDVDARTVMFFESDAGWNAVGGPELMIQQPRHAGVINVGLVDGSVQQLPAGQLQSLRWDP